MTVDHNNHSTISNHWNSQLADPGKSKTLMMMARLLLFESRWIPLPNLRPFGSPVLRFMQPRTFQYEELLTRLQHQCSSINQALDDRNL
jgi:hypothetical protein